MVASTADSLDVELIFARVSEGVIVFVAIMTDVNFVCAVHARQVVRTRNPAFLNQVINSTPRLFLIAVSRWHEPLAPAEATESWFTHLDAMRGEATGGAPVATSPVAPEF